MLHVTSLPGPHGSGDLGAAAYAFVDDLAASGQRWWQMLPVGPPGYGESPYSAQSAFAGNPDLVDLAPLGVPIDAHTFPVHEVDFAATQPFRARHLRRAFEARGEDGEDARDLRAFCTREADWLDDFALYAALKRAHGDVEWTRWPAPLAHRDPKALERARTEHREAIALAKFTQWQFDRQWGRLRAHAEKRGVGLIGDVPIFVAHDSADVWQHRELFDLDDAGLPRSVAGVPPDYFSADGQRWGNPLYRWGALAKRGYDWWVRRMRAALRRFDVVRLDHFIGFVRYWKIPARDETARNGRWMKGPGRPLFDAIRAGVGGDLPLIAEDLGAVTPAVTRLRRELGLPGMRILQFAFGTDPQAAAFVPHAHARNSVVYTGTHDNDTIVGWFEDEGGAPGSPRTREAAAAERAAALAYLGRSEGPRGSLPPDIHWEMVRLAQSSVARTAIVPMQDLLGLGSDARMNSPGRHDAGAGNWRFRVPPGFYSPALRDRLLAFTRTYGRCK